MDKGNTLPLLAIVGATASGKSKLAQALADQWRASLVSVDSRKVYRGLDIGTAKPSREAIATYDYGMVDIVDPDQPFSADDYCKQARALVAERLDRGERVILVGGTGFYLEAFRNGLAELPDIDPAIRQAVQDEAERDGWPSIHREMSEVDPEWAAEIAPNDRTRLQRAAELYRQTGTTLSQWLRQSRSEPAPWPMVVIEVVHPREELHHRIAERTDKMIAMGLADEVKSLLEKGYTANDPGLATVGYVETIDFLGGALTADHWREQIIIHTRQYAKRQRTWFRQRDYATPLPMNDAVQQEVTRIIERSE
ncbi:MAG: tRNA (adenosine(37)-N6)-dimethylallyltransferase MiaA [candidate division Zixibacteria bacterium]|nr:tRNA (adenosine(37)-N6)-dimethylallyltransferase MiaA [candidate division Zixibacteria bacterium]